MEKKLGMDLKGRPTMVTARGVSAARDGQIHTDSRTKLVTVLIYMNNAWEAKTGRLRLLRGPDDLEDVIAEVPPDEGTLLIFRNEPNAWHGFHAFRRPAPGDPAQLGDGHGRGAARADPPPASARSSSGLAARAHRRIAPVRSDERRMSASGRDRIRASSREIADAMAGRGLFHIGGFQRHLAEAAGNIEHIGGLGQARKPRAQFAASAPSPSSMPRRKCEVPGARSG